MTAKPDLDTRDIEELSQIWYEHQVLEQEQINVQEKFYNLIERIFEVGPSSENANHEDWKLARKQPTLRNRQLLLERLNQVLHYNRDLAVLFEKQCLQRVRAGSRSEFDSTRDA